MTQPLFGRVHPVSEFGPEQAGYLGHGSAPIHVAPNEGPHFIQADPIGRQPVQESVHEPP
jgi:hypothetical protein